MLSEKKILQILHSQKERTKKIAPYDFHIIIKDVTESTNNDAKNFIKTYSCVNEKNTVILAKEQTAGRGRMGHSFFSPKGSGLYLTCVLMHNIQPNESSFSAFQKLNPATITVSAAVAVSKAVENLCGVYPDVKWVNDLFYKGKKICGILTEGCINASKGQIDKIIVGVGLNVKSFNDTLPQEIANIAGSLHCDNMDMNIMACEIILQIYEHCNFATNNWNKILADYKKRLPFLQKNVTVIDKVNGNFDAKVLDMDSQANLIVQTYDGQMRKLNSGEISVKM
ncbi:MAG: biotin--[acetyl-CoA-carboxylase] ligase [Treponema sp.]|nr:biotin--[acetyl-CoA-carboxylase] ligase [Treponema sp.]